MSWKIDFAWRTYFPNFKLFSRLLVLQRVLHFFLYSEPIGIQHTSQLVQACGFFQSKELIAYLPDSYRENFTFGFSKKSALGECISAKEPRVILFSPKTDLVIAFPWRSAPVQSSGSTINCNTIETLELPTEQTDLNFDAIPLYSQQNRTKTQNLSKTDCAGCHVGRPIWPSYPKWPGFFGSDDDTLIIGTSEHTSYRDFLRSLTQEERAMFIWPRNSWEYYSDRAIWGSVALSGGKDFFDLMQQITPYQLDSSSSKKGPYSHRPNGRLGAKLIEILTRRNLNRVRLSPHLEQFKIATLLLYCPDLIESVDIGKFDFDFQSDISKSRGQKDGQRYIEGFVIRSILKKLLFPDISDLTMAPLSFGPNGTEVKYGYYNDGLIDSGHLFLNMALSRDQELRSSLEYLNGYDANFLKNFFPTLNFTKPYSPLSSNSLKYQQMCDTVKTRVERLGTASDVRPDLGPKRM